MKRRITRLAVVLVAGVGCSRTPASRDGPGQIDVHWTGSEEGTLSGRATAEWCAVFRQLEIRAIRSDTGFAVAIYPTDTLTPGEYRLLDPAQAKSQPPAAAVALRWVSQTSIKGFQGESGRVVVERSSPGKLSGRIIAAGRSVTDTQRLAVEGTFRDLAIGPPARGCVVSSTRPDEDAEPVDTPLH